VNTLRVEWCGKMTADPMGDEEEDDVGGQESRALGVLNEMVLRHGVSLPVGCEAGAGMCGVELEAWRNKLISKQVVEGKNQPAQFTKLRNSLLAKKQIDVGEGYVWVPLWAR
jgi:hypothetical protein